MPRIVINGTPHQADEKTTVAAALMNLGITSRTSVSGQPRNPLCGMGICFECRVTIDGIAYQRGCLVEVREGMEVSTDAI